MWPRAALACIVSAVALLVTPAPAMGVCLPGLLAEPALPPVGAPTPARGGLPLALVIWAGEKEALAWPASHGAMISGEAGASAGDTEDCPLPLPAGYHPALRFTTSDGRLGRVGFGVCQTAGGLCDWVEVARP